MSIHNISTYPDNKLNFTVNAKVKVNAFVLVPSGTKNFNIPLEGEHPIDTEQFRDKTHKNYGGGTKYVYLLPVKEFIKGLPIENKLVTSNSNGKIIPYSNYDPSCDCLTRYKKFSQYSEFAVWNKWLPNKYNVKDMIYKLRNMPQYHHLSVACIGYDSRSVPKPDVQLGISGSIDEQDKIYDHDASKHAAAREVWEELGLSGNGTPTSSVNNAFPIEKCVFSSGNVFLFVII